MEADSGGWREGRSSWELSEEGEDGIVMVRESRQN